MLDNYIILDNIILYKNEDHSLKLFIIFNIDYNQNEPDGWNIWKVQFTRYFARMILMTSLGIYIYYISILFMFSRNNTQIWKSICPMSLLK